MRYLLAIGAAVCAYYAHEVGHTIESGLIFAAAIIVMERALPKASEPKA